ncbi:MAG: DNA-binding protein [Candidatus Omnitrophota bacterium]
MRYIPLVALLVTLSFCHLVACSDAVGVSSDELIQRAGEYDGKEVLFQGEVIGDVMKRGEFCWVNVSDGKGALGIFSAAGLMDNIAAAGDYNYAGDVIEIKGVFHRACAEHGGDMDIHADSVIKIKDGYRFARAINQKKARAILWLLPILSAVIAATVVTRKIKNKAGVL